ncbi:MAG: hypothetical protein KBD56_06460 [Candidatus Eisenbacteria bacterium]|nr:hypothetical protein [Candidatus Eisenbacteria bacterium]
MTARLHLERKEQEIVREALAYVSRRLYDQHASEVVGDLEDWLDEILLRKSGPGPGTLIMTDEHARMLYSALQSYSDALDHPSTDRSNRARIACMRRIMARARSQRRLPSRMWNWLRGFSRKK